MTLRTAAAAGGALLVVTATACTPTGRAPEPTSDREPAPRSAPSVSRGPVCDRIASPAGARHVRGTLPGAVALVRRLRPGETGCLRGGRYLEDVTIAGHDVRLRSYPGERATIVGRLWVRGEAYDVTIARLDLDGRNRRELPSPTVNGDRITFSRVDVTNRHTAICFILGGSRQYGRAQGTTIRFSRIHHCGVRPSRNTNHGIYVSVADDTRILGNVIDHNTDRGIQLYPDAQRTLIVGNVIDRNGEGIIFSGAGGATSRDNVVRHNVISNSRIRANVESFYPSGTPVGTGNLVVRNCLYGGDGPTRLEPGWRGFAAADNVYANPRYAAPSRGDFRVARRSPCAAVLRAGLAEARAR